MATPLNGFLQLALDLFAPAAAAAPQPLRPVGAPQPLCPVGAPQPLHRPATHCGDRSEGFEPLSDAQRPRAAPDLIANQVTIDAVQPRYRHPQATRESTLAGVHVAYAFRRARRKSIGMVVGPDGLAVSAPAWVTLRAVEEALQEKAAWIVRKLAEQHERTARLEAKRIEWRDGASLPYLGETVIVVLDPRHGFDGVGALLHSGEQVDQASGNASLPGIARHTLHVALPQQASPQQIKDAVQAWLMRQARRVFTERLDHFAPRLGVQWRRLSLSSAGTRWGSASADGSIRLNWRLIHFSRSAIDYVVAHELSHLREMNHSPAFWDTVASVVPDYANLRGQLRDEAIPRWD
jgi:predicted metal-dependent hydrolase